MPSLQDLQNAFGNLSPHWINISHQSPTKAYFLGESGLLLRHITTVMPSAGFPFTFPPLDCSIVCSTISLPFRGHPRLRIWSEFEAKENRSCNLGSHFLSWPLIGKRDLNSSLFTLRSSLIWVQSYADFSQWPNFFGEFVIKKSQKACN